MLIFIGFVLISLREIVPPFITVILANTLIVLGYSFIARGLNDFAGVAQNVWLDIFSLIVFIIGFFYFTYASPNVTARIVTVSLVIMLICLRCAYIALRKIPPILTEKNLLLTIIFVSLSLWLLLRSVLTISFEVNIQDFMTAGIIQGLNIVVSSIGNIFIVIGLININAQRLEKQVNEHAAKLTELNNELKENEERFRSLSDASFEGIAIFDQGVSLEVNNAMAEMLGYSATELVGMNAIEVVAPEAKEDVQNKLLSGYDKPFTSTGIKKDGTKFPIEIHGKIFTYKGRQVRVSAIRDLSDKKKAEEMLLESERMKGVLEMAGAVCHELSQPLMAIMGYLDLVTMNLKEDDPLFDRIYKIKEQSRRLKKITERLMNITEYKTKEYLNSKIIDIEKSSNVR